ncbi:hypothetical protein [Ureibacillus aquaedulcis]|uniref:Uncharacterized protein n=1 Tax=Ureibacillus aquaedulcis TaxID=3058421 RepID=A0ABT8GPL0_9BACL|nr:hypothetical protein [Ureibacillus sp. BA0131]MDN4492851.1 hypothetical protein [Ureibacillus sp. BA0131]
MFRDSGDNTNVNGCLTVQGLVNKLFNEVMSRANSIASKIAPLSNSGYVSLIVMSS